MDALENKNQILMAAYKQLSTIAHAQNAVWRVGEVALVGVLDKSGALVELIEKRDQFGLFPVNLATGPCPSHSSCSLALDYRRPGLLVSQVCQNHVH